MLAFTIAQFKLYIKTQPYNLKKKSIYSIHTKQILHKHLKYVSK